MEDTVEALGAFSPELDRKLPKEVDRLDGGKKCLDRNAKLGVMVLFINFTFLQNQLSAEKVQWAQ